ncbi:MAG: UDP-glucose 4-epimerase GalE [Haemophilus parainfluenzae]|jgi:UDP-glucose 4-epimerase|nr:MAG: UDP-glucose 4-epimerase GalE [Haemophilus parainfluenzae]
MILVTGGSGYIGSHTALTLLNKDHEILILDNLSNSKKSVIHRLEKLSGKKIPFIHGDIRDKALLALLFKNHPIDTVMHFAGLKAVGESVKKPLLYYDNNVAGTLSLLQAMQENEVKNFIFSSSATVYGNPETVPIKENSPVGNTTNPYGDSKYMIEKILIAWQKSQKETSIVLLRYFNPIGAHESGEIGEDPNGVPNNLLPYISQVAMGILPCLSVFGFDYPTVDGTGVRDYIHVVDLAEGHVAALESHRNQNGLYIYNLGTGHGYSVLEIVHAFEKECKQKIPYRLAPRRDGDIAQCYADVTKAKEDLHWQAKRSLKQMIEDTWRWQQKNPPAVQGKALNSDRLSFDDKTLNTQGP